MSRYAARLAERDVPTEVVSLQIHLFTTVRTAATRRRRRGGALALALAAACGGEPDRIEAVANQPPSAMPAHIRPAAGLRWASGPEGLPPGAEVVVLQGELDAPGLLTIRLRLPAGYFLPPHFHPAAESFTVLEGTVRAGSGDRMRPEAERRMRPGDFASIPAGERHWLRVDAPTVLHVHGLGPFIITYADPDLDPRR